WYKNLLLWPVSTLLGDSSIGREMAAKLTAEIGERLIPALSNEAAKIPLSEDDELALDWLNGRRTPDADQTVKGMLTGLDLASDAPRLFKAWVEATCFGARAIVDRFVEEGIPVKGLIGLGGVARKSPYIMQTMADVMNKPIRIHRSEQTCALGSAMFAATAAGLYPKVEEAMHAMGHGFDLEYVPKRSAALLHQKRYSRYLQAAQFGGGSGKVNSSGTISQSTVV
ncbi:MAG TPA: FGGY-family carbohydrate kinase, partial [Chryseosolibacter sp.]|nr:FGGY-family carbohydrate kinase [Chryseosolibacter sp.]